jgi:DNA-3-methyladenine glycosylase I
MIDDRRRRSYINRRASENSMKEPQRCPWSQGNDGLARYHDREWGVPVRRDRRWFEFLTLEGAQAGLSWDTILRKREHYRAALAGFDPAAVARFDRRKIDALLADAGIIRNRLKIESAITNAQAFLEVQREFGSFNRYIWRFVDGKPLQNRWRSACEVPTSTPQSDAMSADLKRRGFRFVGTTICYAFMQATGLVNDHLVTCFRFPETRKPAQPADRAGGSRR